MTHNLIFDDDHRCWLVFFDDAKRSLRTVKRSPTATRKAPTHQVEHAVDAIFQYSIGNSESTDALFHYVDAIFQYLKPRLTQEYSVD